MPRSRLDQVLAAGYGRHASHASHASHLTPERRRVSTGTEVGGLAREYARMGERHNGAELLQEMDTGAAKPRVILKLAGLTNQIKPEKIDEGGEKLINLILQKGVTTIVWDGDLLNHKKEDGTVTRAFTELLSYAFYEFPELEFIYFKKQKSWKKLLKGAKAEPDEYGNNLGPFDFLTDANVARLDPWDPLPPLNPLNPGRRNYAVTFPDDTSWKQLGLLGLQWLKEVAGAEEIQYFVMGKGYIVGKEIEAVACDKDKYPKGIAGKPQFLGVEIKDVRD
jgi:hypothetical protein